MSAGDEAGRGMIVAGGGEWFAMGSGEEGQVRLSPLCISASIPNWSTTTL
jgi:hypothetical protein